MNRSFTARLSRRTPRRLRDYLWATHRIFNESLAYLLKHYFWMQNLTDRESREDNKNRLRTRFTSEQLEWLKLIYRDMMGLDLPKEKRAGRSQSAQAWMEPVTFSRGSKGEGPGASSKNIHPDVKQAIRAVRKSNSWLFDRELALPVSPDNGFRRGLFGSAARRILNFEQNEDTHQGYLDAARKAFERWAGGQQGDDPNKDEVDSRRVGWKRTVLLRDWGKHENAKREAEVEAIGCLTWADFEHARAEFVAYEIDRSKKRAEEHGQTFDSSMIECINGAMTRGWRDIYERLMPPDADRPPADANQVAAIIKAYQTAEPRRIGDINFFLWLADKPHLWRFVESMRRFNDFQRRLDQYARPIQFRYPRYNRRPDWFTFSETSPGHMYTIVSMNPMVIELCVFVPAEEAPVLAKLAKGKPLDAAEKGLLEQPIDWAALRLNANRLTERRAAYVDDLKAKDPGLLGSANLQEVHNWTDDVWLRLLGGFFRDEPPLDSSRFKRMMVRYELATDARLGPFIDSPKDDKELIGRLVVKTNDRQKSHWQGAYRYWFGPLADRNGSLTERRRFLRALPLLVGGIRLEYRGPSNNDPDPIFTLSCELDERITDGNSRAFPAPAHRIPKKESDESLTSDSDGSARRRGPARPRKLPAGLKILAIDLGQRHVATGAVVEFVDNGNGIGILPTPFKPSAVEFINVPGVTLTHIQRHQDERRRKQRKACPRGSRKAFEVRGAHLPRGQLFARELLDHSENLKDDRRKKSAHAILRVALKHGVDYIVFENLKGYRPDMEFGRRTNASLMNWNRRELVEFVKMEAAPLGVGVYEWVPPHHTSRFCHRCGGVGCRFTHLTELDAAKDTLAPAEPAVDALGTPLLDSKGKQVFRRKWTPSARRVRGAPLGLIAGMRQVIDGGKHFCCCECGLMVNADYNAAMNLARKLAGDFPAYQRYSYTAEQKLWVVDGQSLVGAAFWHRAKALAQARLNCHFAQPSGTPPAGGWPPAFPSETQDSPF